VGNAWATKPVMPTKRWGCVGAGPGNGKVYVIGGMDGINVKGNNEEFDPATGNWTTKAPIPTPRFLASVAVQDGRIYVAGGVSAIFGTSVRIIYLDSVEIYDPAANTWSYGGRLPFARGVGASSSMVNGMIYFTGGYNGVSTLSSAERYNPLIMEWWTRANVLGARAAHALVESSDGYIYLMGGQNITGGVTLGTSGVWTSTGSVLATCERYLKDPAQMGAILWGTPDPAPIGVEAEMVLSVTNSGDADVQGLSPSLAAVSGGSLVALTSGPSPAGPLVLTPGESVFFTWTYSVTGAGTVSFDGSAAGSDAESMAVVSAGDTDDLTCAGQAVLRSSLHVYPLPLAGSGLVTVSFTVSNDGGADATGVLPALAVAPGASLVSYYAGPIPSGAVDVGAGDSVSFTWDFLCVSQGYAMFSATATGSDPLFGAVSTVAGKSTQPSVPAGIQASQADSSIVLRWDANPVFESVTGYTVYRSSYPGFPVGPGFIAGYSQSAQFADTGLLNGRPYFYRVSASNAEGDGEASAEFSGIPVTMPGIAGAVRVTSTGPNPLYANPQRGERIQLLLNVPKGEESLEVSIRSLLGEDIRVIFRGPVSPGQAIYEWDGRNSRGNLVASGGYLAVVRFPDGTSMVKKIAILK